MTTSPDAKDVELIDIGPAPQPPAWCLPGTQPDTTSSGPGHLWFWERVVSDDVSINCEDKIVDDRLVRTEPRIGYSEEPYQGISVERALQLGVDLIAAANIITTSQLEEAQR